jgi:chromosome segregation ATPase
VYKLFRGAIPFSLVTPKGQRHESQDAIVKGLTSTFRLEETSMKEDADEAQAKAMAKELEASDAATVAKGHSDRVAECKAQLESKVQARDAFEQGVRDAVQALETADAREKGLPKEVEEIKAEVQDYDKILNKIWQGLKGDQWNVRGQYKKRAVMIDHMLAVFTELGAEESFLDAVEPLCKKESAKRTEFGQATLQHGDGIIVGHIEKLQARVRDEADEAAWRKNAVANAKNALKAAQEKVAAATLEIPDAEKVVRLEDAAYQEAQSKADSIATEHAALLDHHKALGRKLTQFKEFVKQFEGVRDRSPPGGTRRASRHHALMQSAASGAAAVPLADGAAGGAGDEMVAAEKSDAAAAASSSGGGAGSA